MKKITAYLLLLTGVLMVWSCGRKVSSVAETVEIIDMHTSEISLDWAGVYDGNIPINQGETARVVLRLSVLEDYFIEVNEENFSGRFKWAPDGQVIELLEFDKIGNRFFVGENHLVLLDKNGAIPRDERFILEKRDSVVRDIENIYWELIEVNGKKVSEYGSQLKSPEFTFDAVVNRISGNAGCNVMGADYEISENGKIKINPMFSTKMACLNMELEDEVGDVFPQVNRYEIGEDNILVLYNAENEALLKFRYKN